MDHSLIYLQQIYSLHLQFMGYVSYKQIGLGGFTQGWLYNCIMWFEEEKGNTER